MEIDQILKQATAYKKSDGFSFALDFLINSYHESKPIGYELLPAFQGQGIMQEATSKVIAFGLDVIGLKAIEAYTHLENENSSNLLKKFNFKK